MPPISSFEKTLIALALSPLSIGTNAATITVDPGNMSGCTLSDAIRSANDVSGATSFGTCATTTDTNNTIVLASNDTITLTAPEGVDDMGECYLYGPGGLPVISSDITIQGNGSTIEHSSAAMTDEFRLIGVDNGANLTLESLTLQNGHASSLLDPLDGYGGALYAYNAGTVTLNDVTVTANKSNSRGAGLYAYETTSLVLNNSTITNNYAYERAGAIGAYYVDAIEITHSLISNNSSAEDAGALDVFVEDSASGTQLSINNSTISSNTANLSEGAYAGGGIVLYRGFTNISNSTISGNSASGGAAIVNDGATVQLINTTVSNNYNKDDSVGSLLPIHHEFYIEYSNAVPAQFCACQLHHRCRSSTLRLHIRYLCCPDYDRKLDRAT